MTTGRPPGQTRRVLAVATAGLIAVGATACSSAKITTTDTRTGRPERLTGPKEVELVARSQSASRSDVVVDQATLDAPGYVAIYSDGGGAPGVRIGQSKLLPEGRHANVKVDAGVHQDASHVWLMLHHEDNGNESLDYPDADPPVPADNGVVVIRITLNRADADGSGD